MRDNKIVISGLIILLVAFSLNQSKNQPTSSIPGGWDISMAVNNAGLTKYLVETNDFDYSSSNIQDVAQEIKSSTSSPYESIKNTARFVYQNVQYSSKISIGYCYEETASLVLDSGKGDCVSMSRLVTAILRAQGIPTRTVGGCLSLANRCSALFAVFPGINAKVTPLVEGDFKKRGFLHEWVEAWDPERGWVVIESTSGQIFPLGCDSYIFYSYDTNQYDRCVISDSNFWNVCSVS